MSLDFTKDKSTAVRQQAITWASVDPDLCRHMASRPRPLSPYGVTRPQWVKDISIAIFKRLKQKSMHKTSGPVCGYLYDGHWYQLGIRHVFVTRNFWRQIVTYVTISTDCLSSLASAHAIISSLVNFDGLSSLAWMEWRFIVWQSDDSNSFSFKFACK